MRTRNKLINYLTIKNKCNFKTLCLWDRKERYWSCWSPNCCMKLSWLRKFKLGSGSDMGTARIVMTVAIRAMTSRAGSTLSALLNLRAVRDAGVRCNVQRLVTSLYPVFVYICQDIYVNILSFASLQYLRLVCGSDGRTYDNECQLRRITCENGDDVTVDFVGACSE